MRKPDFRIYENKHADHSKADQRLCFRYTDSTISLLPKSEILKPLTIFCGYKCVLFNGIALQNEFAIGLLPGCVGRRWSCIGMI